MILRSGKTKPENLWAFRRSSSTSPYQNLVQKIVVWECQVYDSTKNRFCIILGRDIITDLRLDTKFSEHVISGGERPYKRCVAPMVYAISYSFIPLNLTDEVTHKNACLDSYLEEILG